MNKNHKAAIKGWERGKKYTSSKGGKISLLSIMESVHDSAYTLEEDFVEFLNNVHPWLYYNFCVDWSKIGGCKVPKGFNDGIEFGKSVIKDWQNECWKQKIFNYDMLSNYSKYEELLEATNYVFGNKIMYDEGYEAAENKLYEIRQEYLDNIEIEHKKEQEKLKAQRDAAEAENNAKRAREIADEARRNAQSFENEKQARENKMFYEKRDSPWSNSVVDKKPEVVVQSPTLGEIAVKKPLKKSKQVEIPLEKRYADIYNSWKEYFKCANNVSPVITFSPSDGRILLTISIPGREDYSFIDNTFNGVFFKAEAQMEALVKAREKEKERDETRKKKEQEINDLKKKLQQMVEELNKI